MQRDFDLVVTILGELRDADTASLSRADIEAAVRASMPDAPPVALIAHHLDILADAGLIAPDGSPAGAAWRLTWKGHDALDQQDEDEDDEEEDEDDEDD
ncbi:DUF2513 domain-containing protein [Bordetella petrii]|uniref:DUF2513 domain-containing protein n=1 Tax=Bordetella petrii TaxID=94624 RepID=UPI001A968B00|nr:DUF2513 domain-containing protein [Bordetella petrii]MBO1111634.1 DUF2513 domain-containing protein [Bordetella petrii]